MSNYRRQAADLIASIAVECEKLEDETTDDYLLNAFARIGGTAEAALAVILKEMDDDEDIATV